MWQFQAVFVSYLDKNVSVEWESSAISNEIEGTSNQSSVNAANDSVHKISFIFQPVSEPYQSVHVCKDHETRCDRNSDDKETKSRFLLKGLITEVHLLYGQKTLSLTNRLKNRLNNLLLYLIVVKWYV